MKSGVATLSGPAMLPPTYCISIMLGPMLAIMLSAYWLPVRPSVATRMMEAEPMTMPSMVSRNRRLAGAEAVDGEVQGFAEGDGRACAAESALEGFGGGRHIAGNPPGCSFVVEFSADSLRAGSGAEVGIR